MSYGKFDMTEVVDENISTKAWDRVRSNLASTLAFDPDGSRGIVKDAFKYVQREKQVTDDLLFENFDESIYPLYGLRVEKKDESLTRKDFAAARMALGMNFCKERIEDTLKLGHYLLEKGEFPELQQGKTAKKQQIANPPVRRRRSRLPIIIGVLLAALLIVILLQMYGNQDRLMYNLGDRITHAERIDISSAGLTDRAKTIDRNVRCEKA